MANLEQCRSHHRECSIEDPNWMLPTRVLDVGQDSGSLASDVTLYVAKGERREYLCLSHCWGTDGKPLETKRDTLGEFQRGIQWERLTKTFQEAIIFTRKLGIRFLWIDSLCIVQDDKDDWARESGMMADIYENATLTLAAASSIDSYGGLFRAAASGARLAPEQDQDGTCERSVSMRRFPNPLFFEYRTKENDA